MPPSCPLAASAAAPAEITRPMTAVLTEADLAEQALQSLRWPRGRPLCPHCGCRQAYRLTCHRAGGVRFKCAGCRKQYSARRGTVMERSNVSTGRWLVALALALDSRERGLAARIQRATGVSYKTAWSMVHRLEQVPDDPLVAAMRRAMAQGGVILASGGRATDASGGRATDGQPSQRLVFRSPSPQSLATARDPAPSLMAAPLAVPT